MERRARCGSLPPSSTLGGVFPGAKHGLNSRAKVAAAPWATGAAHECLPMGRPFAAASPPLALSIGGFADYSEDRESLTASQSGSTPMDEFALSKLARNEALFREVNERISELREDWGSEDCR